MNKNVAVVLAGCGYLDGSEIYETTLTLLRLDQLKIPFTCFAPDIEQHDVIDHRTEQAMQGETRNVLTESARLARGNIEALDALDPEQFDAIIVPGGFGAAKNLCDFAISGDSITVLPELVEKVRPFFEAKKPIGLMCIAPVMVPKMLSGSVPVTIGDDASIAGAISSMGGLHRSCSVDNIVVDHEHRVVTTPAYLLAENLDEASKGIFKLVDKVAELMR
ncbi:MULTISPECIES: isoprenoid biosynthesis glyoxalase ElbB [Larsenimonas]|uniref:Glyoxalase n=1 Tax=Larsenimonas suaedae TaxID=1851019 RepID=A0ABU1GSA6_9GAMM|nr:MULTISPECIES: isoprenoid biosynthesis glyoxalase ElbB [Larsenimonas]MCM2972297.1 isoprenoid biosynthesis glyoxalase ElbB [Larsenimonas suaedae]MCM5704139.1 isoprenoid biosynthesis glyoxalase ElbB [Larsenimonas salina]MDR5894907.1 isoprenoid biosynthesis glyoxalase ElbB [Larsenimonas suaedae]